MQFNQMNVKGESLMSFPTIYKDYQKTIGPCGNGPQEISEASCQGHGEVFTAMNGTGLCTCHKMNNFYPVGVEEVALNVRHVFDTPVTLKPKWNKNQRSGPTTVYTHICKNDNIDEFGKKCSGKNRYKTLHGASQATISIKISEWFDVLDKAKGLETVNSEGTSGRVQLPGIDASALTYRTTGVKIKLTFDYRGSNGVSAGDPTKWEDGIHCFVYAELDEGWHSFGSSVLYSDQMNCKCPTSVPRKMTWIYA